MRRQDDPVNDIDFLRSLDQSKNELSVDRIISSALDSMYGLGPRAGAGTGAGTGAAAGTGTGTGTLSSTGTGAASLPAARHAMEHVSDATILLQKRRQVQDYQGVLDERRTLFHDELDMLQEREAVIAGQRRDLDNAKRRFASFVRENVEKREHALLRMHEEYSNEEQLRALQQELLLTQEALAVRLRLLRREAGAMAAYKAFLDAVTASSEEFRSADQILQRYASLQQTHLDLMGRVADEQQAAERARGDAARVEKDQGSRILSVNSETASVIRTLDEKERNATGLALGIYKQQLGVERLTVCIGEIVLGIDNLYLRCLSNSKIGRENDPSLSLGDKLQVISEVIGDLDGLAAQAEQDGLALDGP